jgi:integrase
MSHLRNFSLAEAIKKVPERVSVEMTFAELVHAYTAHNPSTGNDMRLRKWLKPFGDRSAWSLTRDDFMRATEAMKEHGYKASSANRDLSALGSVYKWADKRKICPSDFRSPTLDIRREGETMKRVFMDAAEQQRLRDGAAAFKNRSFHLFVCLLLDSGARKGELLDRRWTDLDAERREIVLQAEDTKTGIPRVLHFTPATASLILRLQPSKARRDEFVFPGRRGGTIDFRKPWKELVTAIGRPELTMHDMRHVVAASLLKAGTTAIVASQVMGHSSLILVRRYGHLETAAIKAAQEAAWERNGLAVVGRASPDRAGPEVA